MPARSRVPTRGLLALAVAIVMIAPTGAVASSPGDGEARSRALYVEPGLEYVAVAPTQLARFLGPLVEWKTDRGVPAQIFNVDQIVGVYDGRDDAERLHNFLQDLYYNLTGGTPRWLLLAGDPDLVPVRYLWADRDHTGDTSAGRNLYLGDTYFSGLGSDWDADGDGVFGEPGEEDLTPELYVGRISASLPEELEAAVAKTMAYEMDPPEGDWYGNAFLAGALMDEPNLVDDPYSLPGSAGSRDEGFDPHTDNGFEVTQKVRAVMGDGYDVVELVDYPFVEACRYTAATDTLDHDSAAAAWDRGNAFVFWASHGYEAFGGLAEYAGTGSSGMFESAQPFILWADTKTNSTGGMLPLVYISSCYAGQFDKEDHTNFEEMITAPEGGAIALVAGDGDTFRLENISEESFGNWWLSERFWQLVFQEGVARSGEALGRLKAEYHVHYLNRGPPPSDGIDMDYFYANLYAYNLQGDPEVPVWLGPPQRLHLELLGGAVFNSPSFKVRVTDRATGEPVAGATVFARGAGLVGIREVMSGPDGVATIAPGPSVMGEELRIAVTGANSVPDRLVLEVGEGVLDLHLDPDAIEGPVSEDFLGQALEFRVAVANRGDFDMTSVDVLFDPGDANGNGGAGGGDQTRSVDLQVGEGLTLTFQHAYSAPGTYLARVVLDPNGRVAEVDEGDNEAVHELVLRALPTLPGSVGPFGVVTGQVLDPPLDLRSYVLFEEGQADAVSFELISASEGMAAWVGTDGLLRVLPDAGLSGPATVVVLMWNGTTPCAEMTVEFDVEGLNSPPSIAPIPDQEVEAGGVLVLEVNATDPDGDVVQLSTSLEGASIEDGVIEWSAPRSAGQLFPTVTVVDGAGAVAQVRFRLSVVARNTEPAIWGLEDEVTVEEGEVALVPVGALDADGDRLTFHLASSDKGFSIDAATGLLRFDSADLGPGTYTATVVVTDGVASVEQRMEVMVEGTGTVPVLPLMVAGLAMLALVGLAFALRR